MDRISSALLSVFLITSTPSTAEYIAPPQDELINVIEMSKEDYVELTNTFAVKWGIDEALFNFVIKCESGYNPDAVNWSDSHKLSKGSHGIAQFSKETFMQFAKQMGEDYTDPYNAREALDVAGYAIKNGYGRHWSCYRTYLNR